MAMGAYRHVHVSQGRGIMLLTSLGERAMHPDFGCGTQPTSEGGLPGRPLLRPLARS